MSTYLHTMYIAAMLNVDPPSKIQGYTAGVDDPAPPTNHGSGILYGPWMTQRTGVVVVVARHGWPRVLSQTRPSLLGDTPVPNDTDPPSGPYQSHLLYYAHFLQRRLPACLDPIDHGH